MPGVDEGHRDLAVFLNVDVPHTAPERARGDVVDDFLRRAIEHGDAVAIGGTVDGRSRARALEVRQITGRHPHPRTARGSRLGLRRIRREILDHARPGPPHRAACVNRLLCRDVKARSLNVDALARLPHERQWRAPTPDVRRRAERMRSCPRPRMWTAANPTRSLEAAIDAL